MSFRISASHKRASSIKNYTYEVGSVAQVLIDEGQLIIADEAFRAYPWLGEELAGKSVIWLLPHHDVEYSN